MEKTLEDLKAVRKLLGKRRIEAALVIKDAINDESIAKLAMIHAAVAARSASRVISSSTPHLPERMSQRPRT